VDKQLNVQLNLTTGSNQGAKALAEQAKAAKELADRLGNVRQLRAVPALNLPGPPKPLPELSFARLQAKVLPAIVGSTSQTKVPLAGSELSEARQLAKAEVQVRKEIAEDLKRAKEKEIHARAYMNVTGKPLPGTEAEPGRGPSVSGGLRHVSAVLPSLTNQMLQFDAPTYGNSMAQVGRAGNLLQTAFGGLPGPLGLVANLAGGLGQAIAALGEAMKETRPSVQELSSVMREQAATRNQVRLTGLPSAEQVRVAFAGTSMGQQIAGEANQAPQNRLNTFRDARTMAQAEVTQLGNLRRGAGRAELEVLLTQFRDTARTAGANQIWQVPDMADMTVGGRREAATTRLNQLLQRYNVQQHEIPRELEGFQTRNTARAMTDQQIREMAETIMTARLTRAQSRLGLTDAILRGGMLPNMRPGAPGLEDLPNLFQSRQGDVLDIHAQVQQEVIRDQREEARWQAQMRLWQEINRSLQDLRIPQVG
jgi:hypothetical protein